MVDIRVSLTVYPTKFFYLFFLLSLFLILFFFSIKNVANLFFVYFHLFKQTILTTNKCEKVSIKYPAQGFELSTFWLRVSYLDQGSRPLSNHVSPNQLISTLSCCVIVVPMLGKRLSILHVNLRLKSWWPNCWGGYARVCGVFGNK